MKKFRITHHLVVLLALCVALASATAAETPTLPDKDKQFLTAYEKAHAALAADDLSGAKAAAAYLGNDGAELSKSSSLEDARAAFETLSTKAKQLAARQSGYHVYHCPMLKMDWVQISTTTANPYGGKDMITCGEMKK